MDTITVTRLLQVRKEIPLGQRRVLVQALSSADLRAQAQLASLTGLRMKQSLADQDGDVYQGLIAAALVFADRDQLVEWCLGFKLGTLQREAFERHEDHFIPFPDDATETERMDTLAKREQAAEALAQLRGKFVMDGMEAYRQELVGKSQAELEALYTKERHDSLINDAWRMGRDNAELLFGVRSLDGAPYFADLAEVDRLSDMVKAYLLGEVRSVNEIDPLNWSSLSSTDSPGAPGS